MSFTMKTKLDKDLGVRRYCLTIGYDEFWFDSKAEAMRAYAAMERAHRNTSVTLKHTDRYGVEHTDTEYGVANTYVECSLGAKKAMGESILADIVEWVDWVKCDGTGVCSCWNAVQGTEVPEDWQEYQDEKGVTRHMCAKCQAKDFEVQPPKVKC